jgi:hypothetical protein
MAYSQEQRQEIINAVCDRMAGGESLTSICKKNPEIPPFQTVLNWVRTDNDFYEQYARARQAQADALFSEIQDIADEVQNDSYIDQNGVERTNHEVVARSKLRIDARKWMAGKLRPKAYGDKIDINLPPVPPGGMGIQSLKGLNDEELQTLQLLLAKSAAAEALESGVLALENKSVDGVD